MRRFEWRLQRVLDVKEIEERTKQAELMKVTETLAARQSELMMLRHALAELISEISRNSPRQRLSEQEHFMKWSAGADDRMKSLAKEIEELVRAQKEKIAELLKVKRFKEGLERLREQAKRRFIKEQEKLEQKDLDEAAKVVFVRGREAAEAETNEADCYLQYQETER
jgi:flagellar export protein FliJ